MPYHYLRPRTDRSGSAEAEFAVAVAEDAGWKPHGPRFKRGKDAPMVMDIETLGNEAFLAKMTGDQLRTYAEEFAGTVFEKTGRDVMTYLSPGFMSELGNKPPAHGEDVWVAAFSAARGKPPTPPGFAPAACAHISSPSTARSRASGWPSTSTSGSATRRACARGSVARRARPAGAASRRRNPR